MNVARYDPFDLFEGVVKSVLRPGFDAAMEGRRNGWTGGMPGSTGIPIDVTENDTSYVVWADLPGVAKEDVSVSVLGNQLTLTAERKQEKAVDQGQREQLVVNERPYGKMSRQLAFAAEIDDGQAQAVYRDGVLQLTLPKKASAQVKRLAIH